jgi:glycosyltransferase involved in cell wall biosynthesis
MGKSNQKAFNNLVKIVRHIADNLIIIEIIPTGIDLEIGNEDISRVKIEHGIGTNLIYSILYNLVTQLKASLQIVISSRKVDNWIFYLGDSMILPMIAANLTRKRTILLLGGNLELENHYQSFENNISKIFLLFRNINLFLADQLVLYSSGLIMRWKLEKHTKKISIAHEHILDSNRLEITTPLEGRSIIIGYVGNLGRIKGVMNLIKSIPSILKDLPDVKFSIIGDGELRGEIEDFILKNNLQKIVDLEGWVQYEHISEHLNELRLLIIPSYSEGLPNVMIEAMACGTPVLATSVGAIPDIIDNGQ